MSKYCLLIPSYQHSQQLKQMMPELEKLNLPCIVVNDGSDYEHSQQLRELANKYSWVNLIEHNENQGKGGAVVSGFFTALEQGFSHAVQVDSDHQHDLGKICEIIKKSRQNSKKLISGCPIYNESVPRARKWGRYMTHIWVWIETLSFKIKDSMCGFRVYPLEATCSLLKKSYVGRGMDFDTEIMVKLFWQSVDVVFVPVLVNYPKDSISHFGMIRDNWLISKMHTRLFFGMILRFPCLILRGMKKVTTRPPVTASPLDERRGEVPTRSFFDLPRLELSVRRREATRKATKPIAKGRAVTEKEVVVKSLVFNR